MRLNRIFLEQKISVGQFIALPTDAVRHLVTVLKVQEGDACILFNGDGRHYFSSVDKVSKKELVVKVTHSEEVNRESPLSLHLFQAVSRGDKMDLTIQKSVELGVQDITPIFTERCGVKLNSDRLDKKMQHWRKVIISACEQCGRNSIPQLHSPIHFDQLIQQNLVWEHTLILNPHSGQSIASLEKKSCFQLVIGPEGGLSEREIEQLQLKGCQNIRLGPRILRTETAGLAVISVLQSVFGDF